MFLKEKHFKPYYLKAAVLRNTLKLVSEFSDLLDPVIHYSRAVNVLHRKSDHAMSQS